MSTQTTTTEAASGAEGRRQIKRIEKDPYGGWIVRRKDGRAFYSEDWRWNSRATARTVKMELDCEEAERAALTTGAAR